MNILLPVKIVVLTLFLVQALNQMFKNKHFRATVNFKANKLRCLDDDMINFLRLSAFSPPVGNLVDGLPTDVSPGPDALHAGRNWVAFA